MNQDINEITDEYDREFISLMIAIEKRSEVLNKYDKLRIKNWCKKLCQITNNIEWKKNRNLHAICILDAVLNEHFEEPYNKFPPEGSVPILNKALVKSKLTKKFFEETLNMQQEEELQQQEEENNNNNNMNNNEGDEMDENQEIEGVNEERRIINEQQVEINKLVNLLKEKDNEIEKLNEEKRNMEGRIDELEKMLANFMGMENNEQEQEQMGEEYNEENEQ